MKQYWSVASGVLAGIALVSVGGVAKAADSGADFFKGKTVTYIVATAPGGGYDVYGRLISRYMEKYLPGSKFIVKNVPGAGHIIGANQVYAARADGLTIGTFNTGLIYAQLQGAEGIRFDLNKYTWIGKASTDPRTVMVSAKSDVNSIDDLRKAGPKIKFAASGVGSAAYNETKMLIESLEWNVDLIPGYNGRDDEMAILRGEVMGSVGSLSTYEPFVREKNGKFLMQIGGKPTAGVPLASSLNLSGRAKAVVALINSQGELGRLTAAPPGLPADRTKALVDAYRKAMEDPQLQVEAAKLDRPVEPLYGEEVAAMVKEALTQDAETVALMKALLSADAPSGTKVSGPLLIVGEGGREVTFKGPDGKEVKSAVSGSRSKLTIAGKEVERKDLKVGLVCDIEYKPGGDNEPSKIACK